MNKKIVTRSGWDRLRYALMFETLLVVSLGIALATILDHSPSETFALAAALSLMALLINLLYNHFYDRIDVYYDRIPTERSFFGRAVHAVGFELILAVTSLPIMMWWLGLSLWDALLLDIGMMAVIVVYTFVFTFIYDKCFPIQQPDDSQAHS